MICRNNFFFYSCLILCLSLVTSNKPVYGYDEVTDLELSVKEDLSQLLRKEKKFNTTRIDDITINDSVDSINLIIKCVADNSVDENALYSFFKEGLAKSDQTKRLVEATVKVEVTHLPFTTTISNEIQALLLSDENISQYGKFRLQSISFGKENGINIRFESASLDDATPLNEEVISAITVALESRIFSNDEVKEYGGEDRFFNTTITHDDSNHLRSSIRDLFHTELRPNAIQVLGIEPTMDRGVKVSVSQSMDTSPEVLKASLTKMLQADAGFTTPDALSSEVATTKNNVLVMQSELRKIVHKHEEAYVADFYFDDNGNLVAPVFTNAKLSQSTLTTSFASLIRADQTNTLAAETKGIVKLELMSTSIKESLNEFIRTTKLVGAQITEIAYGNDLSVDINGYVDNANDLESIRKFVNKLADSPGTSLNFPGKVNYQRVKFYPIRVIPEVLNTINDTHLYLKHVEITAVNQRDLNSPLIIDIKYHSPFIREEVCTAVHSILTAINDFSPRLKHGITLGKEIDDSHQLTVESDIKKEIREVSTVLRSLANGKRKGGELNLKKINEVRETIDKRLRTNPARSSFWFLKAYTEYLVGENPALVNRLLYNVVDIETKFPELRNNRGNAVANLRDDDEFYNLLKGIRNKTIVDQRVKHYREVFQNM